MRRQNLHSKSLTGGLTAPEERLEEEAPPEVGGRAVEGTHSQGP